MRLIPTSMLKEGAELAKPIYDSYGRVLVQENMRLTKGMITRLQVGGVTYVYIRDEYTDDIMVEPLIEEEYRQEAIMKIKNVFDTFQPEDIHRTTYLLDSAAHTVYDLAKDLVTELDKKQEAIQFLSDILVVDDYVFTHSLNVTMYTLVLAKKLDLSDKEVEALGVGALLHDIGKIFIPPSILNKPSHLTDEEFEIVKAHTEYGYDLLRKQHQFPMVVAHCAYQHHERIDGSGYPRGLKNYEIHKFGKIIGVADVFDAMTSNRVYREAMLPHDAMEVLYGGADIKFEKHMVEQFKQSIALYPNGLTVLLNDGRKGIVTRQHPHLFHRPVVRVIEEEGQKISPYDVDLAKILNVMIIDTGQLNLTMK